MSEIFSNFALANENRHLSFVFLCMYVTIRLIFVTSWSHDNLKNTHN